MKSILIIPTISQFTGVYGDVQRVKILYNKKDSALIQMAEPQQAYLGKSNMPKPTALPSSPPTGHPKSNEKSALVAALKGASDPKKKKEENKTGRSSWEW